MTDNSGVFFIWYVSPYLKIFKYEFSTSLVCQYHSQEIQVAVSVGFGFQMIKNSEFFFSRIDNTSPYTTHFHKFTFQNFNVDWKKMMLWSGGTWGSSFSSESVISSDTSKIYSFYTSGNLLYFATFNSLNGDIIDSIYRSNQNIYKVNCVTLSESYISVIILNTGTNYSVLLFDLSLSTFIIRMTTYNIIGCGVEPFSGR